MFLCSFVFDFLTIFCSILFLHFLELWLVYFYIFFIALFCFIASLLQEFFIQVIFSWQAFLFLLLSMFFLIYMFFVYSSDRAMFFIFLMIASLLQEFCIQVIFLWQAFFIPTVIHVFPYLHVFCLFFRSGNFFHIFNECTKKCIVGYISIVCRSNVSPFFSA